MGFESAPFKFTNEYLEIMGGIDSSMFEYFKTLLLKALYELRKDIE